MGVCVSRQAGCGMPLIVTKIGASTPTLYHCFMPDPCAWKYVVPHEAAFPHSVGCRGDTGFCFVFFMVVRFFLYEC